MNKGAKSIAMCSKRCLETFYNLQGKYPQDLQLFAPNGHLLDKDPKTGVLQLGQRNRLKSRKMTTPKVRTAHPIDVTT